MQLWFDDPSTLLPKMRVASKNGLRGVGFWNVDLLAYGSSAGAATTARQREQTDAMWGAVREAVRGWGSEARQGQQHPQETAAVLRR